MRKKVTNEKPKSPRFTAVMKSTLAAAFGVQSDKNRQEDFSGSSVLPYIVAGVVFTVAFIAILVAIAYAVSKSL